MAAYIAQLTPMEQKILKIAASHLETSFSLCKSIGYQEWQAQQAQQKEQQAQQPKEQQQKEQQPKEQQQKEQQPKEQQAKPQEKIIIMVKRKLKPTPH